MSVNRSRQLQIFCVMIVALTMCRNSHGFRKPQFLKVAPRSLPMRLQMSTNDVSKPKKDKKKKEGEGKYSKTVFLPQTSFDQRANSLKREPELQKWWLDEKIYDQILETNTGENFVLHDGPPYANGNLHIGHSLNKILKDFINKYQILKGKKVSYVPGWDCHGLPIELKVLQSMKASEREKLTPVTLRKKAAEFAKEAMVAQRESFKRYGVSARTFITKLHSCSFSTHTTH